MRPEPSLLWLLAGMIALQAVWLVGIRWSKASSRIDKLRRCAILYSISSLVILLSVLIVPRLWQKIEATYFQVANIQPLGIVILGVIALSGAFAYATRQQVWSFDEQGNLAAARQISEFGLWQSLGKYNELQWLGMQHPPLIPWLGSNLLRWFGDRLIVLRLLSIAFLGGILALTYQFGGLLFGKTTGYTAALLILVFPLIWRLGSAALLDIPVTFWFELALFLSLDYPTLGQKPLWIAALAGFIIGLGLLTRYTMVFIYPVELAFLIIGWLAWSSFIVMMSVSIAIFAVWVIFASSRGILRIQYDRMLIYAGRRPGTASPQQQSKGILGKLGITRGWRMRLRLESLVTRLPSALGVYSLVILFFGCVMIYRAALPPDKILLAWIVIPFSFLLILMPDHRYFLPIFPALALVMARGLVANGLLITPVICLALLFCIGNLYLFLDWQRQSYLFSRTGV